MSIIKTRTHQAVVAIVGMIVLGIGLGIVYATGTPTPYFVAEKIKHRELLDLLSYVLPILAAVAAGAGLFVGYPGVQRASKHQASMVAEEGRSPGDADLRAFYIFSLALLLLGLLCYAACHPCRSASMIVIMGCFLWTAILILRARDAEAVANGARGVLRHHLMSGFTLVVIVAIALGIAFFKTLYIGDMCAD